jgi:predicted nucleic-acid-binding protein
VTSSGSLDTNCLVFLLGYGSVAQTKHINALIGKGIYRVSTIALIELEFFLNKKIGLSRAEIAEHIRALLASDHIRSDEKLVVESLSHYTSINSISFVDSLLSVESYTLNKPPLYTFDVQLSKKLPTLTKLV